MRWPRIKVRVKEPSPLQKLRMLPRFRMTQLRQGKQRPKTFLGPRVRGFGFLIAGIIHTCSIAARAILARLLLEQDRGSGVSTSSSFSSPVSSILAQSLLEQDCGFIVPMDYFLQLAFETSLPKPFYVQCTSSLSNKKMTLFYFANLSFFAIIVL